MSSVFRSPLSIRRLTLIAIVTACLSCSLVMQAMGYPPQATRDSQPSSMKPLAVGQKAPAIRLATQRKGQSWSLPSGQQSVVVFYRGSW